MGKQKHTPGPWVECRHSKPVLMLASISDSEGRRVAEVYNYHNAEANAARIVACVNACEGKPNPEQWVKECEQILDKLIDFNHPLIKVGESRLDGLIKLAKERDELLASLKEIKKFVDNDFPPKVEIGKRSLEYTNAWKRMNDLIVKTEEKKGILNQSEIKL